MLEGFDKEVSTYAADVDRAFWITNGISAAMFVLVVGLMLYFIFRYHHSRVAPEEIRNIKDHTPLEIAWTVIPTLLLFVIFYYGYTAFREVRTLPEDAFEVEVVGKRWSWTFIYPNGKQTAELYVPVSENIRLQLHAPVEDVLHSFYVPAFRVKEDVVPGRETHLWFNATVPGRYDIECAEYCGMRHAYMRSHVEVMEQAAFEAWYASDRASPHDTSAPKSGGEALYKTLGCSGCHSLDGSVIVGPSFRGIYGSKTRVRTDGELREATVDEAYIRASVRTPSKDVVEGFQDGLMPNLSEQIDEEQMAAIVAFIREQGGAGEQPETQKVPAQETAATPEPQKAPEQTEASGPPDGASLFKSKGCVACHSLDGSRKVGPSLKGIYQSTQKVVTEGKTREVVADEAYLRRSIEMPNSDVVEGFRQGLMPPFGASLSDEEVDALVSYLRSLK